jgi:hypothetical protein
VRVDHDTAEVAVESIRRWWRSMGRITQSWPGKPLITFEVIVSLIAATRTTTGLQVHSELDTRTYPKGVKVSDKEVADQCTNLCRYARTCLAGLSRSRTSEKLCGARQ